MKILALNIVETDNEKLVSAIINDGTGLKPYTISSNSNQGQYEDIVNFVGGANLATLSEDPELLALIDPDLRRAQTLEVVKTVTHGDMVVNADGSVNYKGQPLPDEVAKLVGNMIAKGSAQNADSEWTSLIAFIDNLFENMDANVRKQLFRWLEFELNDSRGRNIRINQDGHLIGFKGCKGTVEAPMSVHSGFAIVDGVLVEGNIPNKLGSVISMPRSAVTADPKVGCAPGLHVGTYDYASNWGSVLVTVKVDPRDVVSVPYETDSQKMRVSKYTVEDLAENLDMGRIVVPAKGQEQPKVLDIGLMKAQSRGLEAIIPGSAVAYLSSSKGVVSLTVDEVAQVRKSNSGTAQNIVIKTTDGDWLTISRDKLLNVVDAVGEGITIHFQHPDLGDLLYPNTWSKQK